MAIFTDGSYGTTLKAQMTAWQPGQFPSSRLALAQGLNVFCIPGQTSRQKISTDLVYDLWGREAHKYTSVFEPLYVLRAHLCLYPIPFGHLSSGRVWDCSLLGLGVSHPRGSDQKLYSAVPERSARADCPGRFHCVDAPALAGAMYLIHPSSFHID